MSGRLAKWLNGRSSAPVLPDVYANMVAVVAGASYEKLPQSGCLSLKARESLRDSLSRRLDETGRQVFKWDYRIFQQTPGLRLAEAPDLYLDGGVEPAILRLFSRYPELERLWTAQVDAWLIFVDELVTRLRTFTKSPSVNDLQIDLGDCHIGNRSVSRVTLANFENWFYKPRSGLQEEAWFGLLQWLNEEGLGLPFQLVRVSSQAAWCWMEAVEARPCQSPQEVEAFYQRAGALLFLYQVLGGIDCHAGNLIAAGDQPVIIDVEALFHPVDPLEERGVLRCGFLPVTNENPGRPRRGASALGCRDDGDHALCLGGRRINPADHVDCIIRGYQKMHLFLSGQRRETFAQKARAMAMLPWRRVLRPTQEYYNLWQQSLTPESLQSTAQRRDTMARVLTNPAEANSLLDGDIPLFYEAGRSWEWNFQEDIEQTLSTIRQSLKA